MGKNRKENQIQNDDAKFFDKKNVLFCTGINFDEKFACIDMQNIKVGTVPRIIIVCSSRSHMLRYELSPIDRSLPSKGGASEWQEWECCDLIDIDMPDLGVLRIALSGTAEMSATFECAAGIEFSLNIMNNQARAIPLIRDRCPPLIPMNSDV